MENDSNNLLFVLDIAGTLVAVEGAAAAMRANLDLLGLMVLAFATALGGGIIRDVLIGAVPPASLRDWRYFDGCVYGSRGRFLFASVRVARCATYCWRRSRACYGRTFTQRRRWRDQR
jgi:uncharacterized membrane protein YeiH